VALPDKVVFCFRPHIVWRRLKVSWRVGRASEGLVTVVAVVAGARAVAVLLLYY